MASHPSAVAASNTDTAASTITDLNRFFPFDPYELPLSRSYIDGVYRVWEEVNIVGPADEDEDDDDDSTESDSDQEEDEEPPSGLTMNDTGVPIIFSNARTATSTPEELNDSFGGMSISPMRHPDMSQSSFISTKA